ncbi:hypothetical protein OHB12_08855 [Nocardia sp. NBC_01730]|uniref:hypothetical protein n=1 Tax=Nocardia sp. NBC_01730 TaxID=2975998 RepID=UPI002E13575E|nr:hypothetical protein OHB12_08855 [Nocardia sp. NBC_01730]
MAAPSSNLLRADAACHACRLHHVTTMKAVTTTRTDNQSLGGARAIPADTTTVHIREPHSTGFVPSSSVPGQKISDPLKRRVAVIHTRLAPHPARLRAAQLFALWEIA